MLPAIEKLVKNLKPKYDDDVIDRLNYAYTSALFVLLILVIGTKQYVGEPLQCWMSAEFKNNWEKYVENYCFVENTYFVSFDDDKLPTLQDRERYELKYYQWVPILLILQLLLFLAPKTFWGAVSWKTGLSVKSLIGNQSHADRQQKILTNKNKNEDQSPSKLAARQMREITRFNSRSKNRVLGCITANNSYFTTVYLVYKFLNCVNTFGQLWMMNSFLNTQYTFWGIGILKDLIYERDWRSSGQFPRVTFCDFMRRDDTSSRPMNFTVQCVLMINMFNEKLYIILWFWFSALTILNILNLIYWLFTTFIESWKIYFIQAQLNFADIKYDNSMIPYFLEKWITMDGLTALRLISANCGDLQSSDIVAAMLHDCIKDEEKQEIQRTLDKKAKNGDDSNANLLDPFGGAAPELPKKGSNLHDPFIPGNPGTQKVYPIPQPQPPHAPMEEESNVGRPGPPGMPRMGAPPVYPNLNPYEEIRPIIKKGHEDVASVD
uniref:Innexin n=1 Tax=Panagrolaimus superbus TaxID=310955 RepID=A0A914YWS0_9BILA